MRKSIGILAILCAAVCLLGQARAQEQERFENRARHIFELTNRDRVAQGLQPLRWNDSLANAALQHANRMATEHYLMHQYPGEPGLEQRAAQAGAHFQAIAENIATGYSDEQIEQEWMHSAPHRRNILDPRMNALGVGIVLRGGVLYAVEDFAQASEALSPRQVESRVGNLLRQQGIDPAVPRSVAAQACAPDSGYPSGSRLVMRFDTGDLSQLPGQVVQQIRSGGYRRASVASCPGGQQGSFTTYKVALVLY
jgi:hypothetical protein